MQIMVPFLFSPLFLRVWPYTNGSTPLLGWRCVCRTQPTSTGPSCMLRIEAFTGSCRKSLFYSALWMERRALWGDTLLLRTLFLILGLSGSSLNKPGDAGELCLRQRTRLRADPEVRVERENVAPVSRASQSCFFVDLK